MWTTFKKHIVEFDPQAYALPNRDNSDGFTPDVIAYTQQIPELADNL